MNEVAKITDSPFKLGGINYLSIVALAVVWTSIYFIVKSGTKRLSRILMLTVPLPAVLLIILSLKSTMMPGSYQGLEYFFRPKMDKIFNMSIWAAAASQVVLSLGLGMGQIVAYASKKRDNRKIVTSAITITVSDLVFSLLAGITVFATMGFLANSQGLNVDELQLSGIFLAFVSYPMAISTLPLAPLWGALFFLLLVSLGIDSIFAAVEAIAVGGQEMMPRINSKTIAASICIIGFIGDCFSLLGMDCSA